MPTPQQIANWIVESFDPGTSTKIEKSILQTMNVRGYSRSAAAEACERVDKVLAELRAMPAERLPFTFSEGDGELLVGKQRAHAGDSPETAALRQNFGLVRP